MRPFFRWFTAMAMMMTTGSITIAADLKAGFNDLVFKGEDGLESKYILFVPHTYKAGEDKKYPLILFLHGSGESGSDGKKQAAVGLGPVVRKQEKEFPFFVLFPQANSKFSVGGRWSHKSPDGKRAVEMVDQTVKELPIDAKRIYLTGLSMGGFGTWDLAATYPKKWAAIVPVCGGGDPKTAEKFKDIPCWCTHGDKDGAVPVKMSRDMIAALKAAGGTPKYDEFPGIGHNCWDMTYSKDELYQWLLMQQLP